MEKRLLPLGISDFKRIIDGGYAYVDKSLFIQELVEAGAHVSLIPRMRRFGKTLNLSMLQYFFEKGDKDTSYLFKSLKIWQNEKMKALQGQFPVIFLSLKDIKYSSWEDAFKAFQSLLSNEFRRHRYLLEGNLLDKGEKNNYEKILAKDGDQTLMEQSLSFLSKCLERFHHNKVVLLIDEYDTPAHAAYMGGYYKEAIAFLRNWLSHGLKDNKSLERGVLTGILRIAKETIFSGLNNIITFTLLNNKFYDKFGLLEHEVQQLLAEYGLSNQMEEMKKWYNGYHVGAHAGIYNPWSILNCIYNEGALAPYWVNTSDNALIKELISKGNAELKRDIESLLKGEIVEKEIEEGIVFSNLDNPDVVWSLLLFSGYLTITEPPVYGRPCKLSIPNLEVAEVYRTMVLEWFKTTIHTHHYQLLLRSLTQGDLETFSQIFQDFLTSSVSLFDMGGDQPEKVYHALVLGMLLGLKDTHEVKSNRESGYGRYDVLIIPKNVKELGIIIEFKKVSKAEQGYLNEAAISALKQISDKNYAQELFDRGITRILTLAMAFEGKKVAFLHSFIEKNYIS